MADKKYNTRELDTILAESRTRKSGQAPARKPAQQAAPARKAPVQPARRMEDNFIFTDDYGNAVPAKGAGRPSGKSSGKKQPPKKKKTGLIVTLCIVGIVLLAAIGGVMLYPYITPRNAKSGDTFADNVYVNGVSLKGLTMEEARAEMKKVEEELANGIKVDVKAGDVTKTYTKADFNYSFDTEDILQDAKSYSEEKGKANEDKNFEITMKVEDTTCENIVSNLAGQVKSDPQDAKVVEFDPSADSMFTFSQETKGVSLDQQKSLSALKDFIDKGNISGTVEATVTEVDPTYTKDYLSKNIKKLSSFSTISTNNSNGNENMRLSLSMCNGSIIDPGEVWSFNNCTGDSNLESNGYKPAGVLIQGRSETGVGGGICQSSTTIYNACILCGMEVEERDCHYYKSAYVDAGRDATVDYPRIDLKVKNPFKYQLFMKCWMDGTELNCEIYGLENPDFDDVEITTSGISYTGDGYSVETYRTFYKNGSEVRSETLNTSRYYTSAPSSGGSSSGGGSSDDDDSGSVDSDSDSSSGGESGGEGGEGGESGGGESGGGEGGESGGGESGGGGEGGESGGGESGGGGEGGEGGE